MEYDVDIVIPYVDGSDPAWLEKKAQYDMKQSDAGTSARRFRSWDNLHYLLRGIDKFAPWVRKVFLVTDHQAPEWINSACEKLVLINHEDYIPEKYLPTFSSHTIELNLHRIKDLSEHFIYFNDDTFLIAPLDREAFFRDGLPCDYAVESPYFGGGIMFYHICINDILFINRKYDRNAVRKENWKKLYSLEYPKGALRNLIYSRLIKRNRFFGFETHHLPNPYLKSSFESVWGLGPEWLDTTCMNRFRTDNDVNQYVVKYYQYVNGLYSPFYRGNTGMTISLNDSEKSAKNNISKAVEIISLQQKKIVCVNDSQITHFDEVKERINGAFESILPEKCCFEI